jgi:hypothetical protein
MKSSTSNLLRLISLDSVSESGRIVADIYSRIIQNASSIGPSATAMARINWASSLRIAESDINSFLRLARRMSPARLEAACKRVLFYGFDSIDTVKAVLLQRLDMLSLDPKTDIYGQPDLF